MVLFAAAYRLSASESANCFVVARGHRRASVLPSHPPSSFFFFYIVICGQRSDLWARVSYRGREDGWVLTANKRGPTLVPCGDQAAAAGQFDAQEAAFAAAAAATGGALLEDAADRPLTGAKPPPPAAAAASGGAGGVGEDRPLNGGGGKGSWVPPSEFPPGHEEGLASASAGGGGDGVGDGGGSGDGKGLDAKEQRAVGGVVAESSTGDAPGSAQYMTSLG